MKKIRLLALLVLLFAFSTAMAQTVRVSGVVKSASDGQPLPGVMVQVKGTNNGTGTAGDGSYSLNNVPSDGTLEFRYVGMTPQTVAVNGKTTVDITLADALQADQVTVTALNTRRQNRALGYSATTVKGDDLARTNQVNPINALMGKVAGVQLQTSSSSGVTASPSIVIRGAKSLTKNNSPIFVIDGIVMQNEESNRGTLASSDESMYGNQLKNLNQDDFESMTVLKGAAATSLYGSRGANGAIVITTKSGKVRKGLGIQASYTHEWQDMYAAPIRLQNTYGMGSYGNGYEGDYNEGWKSTATGYTANSFGPRMDQGLVMQQYIQGTNSPLSELKSYKDNWKALFQQGHYDNASVAITGGTNDVTYRLSYGFTKSQGILPNNSFSRHNINFTTTGKINDVISINANVQYANSVTKNPKASNPDAWEWSPIMATTYYMNRSTDIRWVADNYIDPVTFQRMPTGLGWQATNWFNRSTDNNTERQEQTIIARVGLDFKFTDFLDASVSASFNDYKSLNEEKNYGSDALRAGGYYGINHGSSGQYNGLAQLHYGDRFLDDRLEVDVRVIGEIYGSTRSYSSYKRTNGGLITPGLFNFANSVRPITQDQMGTSTTPRNNMTMGLAAMASLGWDNQIYLEVTARNDWVSSLLYPKWLPQGANNYSVFYPSVNASWVFSETFGIDPNVLSFGKLRASWAQVGMGTGAYETASGAGGYEQKSSAGPMSEPVIYANPNNATLPNYDLKPEIQQSIEFGVDLRFLNDRIGIDATYYKTNTFNQILSVGATPESGVGNRLINAGNIQNQGWEFQLDFTPIRTREVNWNIAMNFTRNRGKIVEFHDEIKHYDLMSSRDGGPSIRAFEGGAFGQVVSGNGWGGNPIATQNDPNKAHYGKGILYRAGTSGTPNAVEVFQYLRTGSIANYYKDSETPYTDLGNIQPDFMFGFNTTLSYKGFDLYLQIDGRKGGKVLTPLNRYAHSRGATELTLGGRDAEHGGVARTNYKGETVYNGMVLDGVFSNVNSTVTSLKTGQKVSLEGMSMQEAIDAGHMQPVLSASFWSQEYGNAASNYHVQDMTYVSLREVTLGYNFPEKWVKHVGMQSARLSFTARNLCYIYNGLDGHTNPESITNNNPLTPYDVSGIPFTRSFSLTLNVRF